MESYRLKYKKLYFQLREVSSRYLQIAIFVTHRCQSPFVSIILALLWSVNA